ncbi:MAG: zinc transporter ZntB [Pseudomonadota bacterium]
MSEFNQAIYACHLDGAGGGREIAPPPSDFEAPPPGFLWVHLNRGNPVSHGWLENESGLDSLVVEALLAEETRPRCSPHGEGLILNLRGINLNPGAEPEDMVAVRLWIESTRVISVRGRRIMAVADMKQDIDSGYGPTDVGGFIAELADKLVERMAPVVTQLEDRVDDLEDEALLIEPQALRAQVSDLRRQIIFLRRYIAPQREAIGRLSALTTAWLDPRDHRQLHEISERITHYVEDLGVAWERMAVIQDEVNSRFAEQINRAMYLLSIVACVFLPLTLLTGLLGINVAGIPWAENHWAFAAVCLLLFVLCGFELWIFKKLKWI